MVVVESDIDNTSIHLKSATVNSDIKLYWILCVKQKHDTFLSVMWT